MTSKVTVTVSGLTGSGKSFIYTEIMLALQAIGVPVEHGDEKAWQDIQMSGGEFDRDLYNPTVTLVEQNIPRKARSTLEQGDGTALGKTSQSDAAALRALHGQGDGS